jgi:diketogulonate reductase-like aldo/keto reductase
MLYPQCYNRSMRYETMSNSQIPKIGLGTWRIGGGNNVDHSIDDRSLSALHSALDLGYTHFDTAEIYAAGHAEELLGRAIRDSEKPRERLFITSKVSPSHLRYTDVLKSCTNSLARLNMEYLDLYLIHWPGFGVPLRDTFRALNQLVREERVRYLGVSNFHLALLEKAAALSETHLLTDQVPFSLSDRTYVKNGVLDYCQRNDILLTAYSPVKYRSSWNGKTVQAIAYDHKLTPHQIALAWLVSQPRVITIPMSFDPMHQADNMAVADFVLTEQELKRLD